MHRLIAEVGWPFLILCAVLLAGALPVLIPMLVNWWRFEIELSRRARQYEQREDAARVPRVRW